MQIQLFHGAVFHGSPYGFIGVDWGWVAVKIKGMSPAVLEIAEKAQKLTHEEWEELLEILEDIEDNAAADRALADGVFVSQEQYVAMCRAEGTA